MTAPNAATTTDAWHRLALQVRLALDPEDPRLIARYLTHGQALVAEGAAAPWSVHDRMLTLLLDTANDALLPIDWRMNCLDACCRPLGALGALVCDDASAARLRVLASRLACFSLQPTPDSVHPNHSTHAR